MKYLIYVLVSIPIFAAGFFLGEYLISPLSVERQPRGEPIAVKRMAVVDRVLVGQALVGEGNEIAHIDLVMGPRGSAAEMAFINVLTNNKDGISSTLALVTPNLQAKPNTVLFSKVAIKNEKQVARMIGPTQRAVAMAVTNSVESGIIPANEVEDIFIAIGVFIHPEAEDDNKIQDYNYQATKEAIERAVKRVPQVEDVIANKGRSHPFAPHR